MNLAFGFMLALRWMSAFASRFYVDNVKRNGVGMNEL